MQRFLGIRGPASDLRLDSMLLPTIDVIGATRLPFFEGYPFVFSATLDKAAVVGEFGHTWIKPAANTIICVESAIIRGNAASNTYDFGFLLPAQVATIVEDAFVFGVSISNVIEAASAAELIRQYSNIRISVGTNLTGGGLLSALFARAQVPANDIRQVFFPEPGIILNGDSAAGEALAATGASANTGTGVTFLGRCWTSSK